MNLSQWVAVSTGEAEDRLEGAAVSLARLGTVEMASALRATARRVVILRIAFGVVWGIDAYLKWQPSFVRDFTSTIAEGAQGQPAWLGPWFDFWHDLVARNPHLFAYGSAVAETLLAIGLILGLARRILYVGGALWSLAIWSVPEGFGTPFMPGATDIGTAIMYAILFAALYALEAAVNWSAWTLDGPIQKRIPSWRIVGQPGGRALVDVSAASTDQRS